MADGRLLTLGDPELSNGCVPMGTGTKVPYCKQGGAGPMNIKGKWDGRAMNIRITMLLIHPLFPCGGRYLPLNWPVGVRHWN